MSEPIVPLRELDDDLGELLRQGAPSLRTPPLPAATRARLAGAKARWGWRWGGGAIVGSIAIVAGVRLTTATPSEPPPVGASPSVASVRAPEAPPSTEVPTTPVAELPSSAPSAIRVPRASPPRAPPAHANARSTEDSLAREVSLLERARATSDPTEQLARLDAHAREFPEGALALEREVFAVQALLRAGLTEQAHARGEAVIAKHPASPHAARVKALLR
jgi:hypothetical protein